METELSGIRNQPLSRDEWLKALKPFYDQAREQRIALLAKHLANFRHRTMPRDPFGDVNAFLGSMGALTPIMAPAFDWQEVLEAVKSLPAGINEAGRERQMANSQKDWPSSRLIWPSANRRAAFCGIGENH